MRKPWQLSVLIGILAVGLIGSAWAQKGVPIDPSMFKTCGFEQLKADTAEQKEKLKAMPQKQFVTAKSKKGKKLYLCADSDTGALWVGSEDCYKNFCQIAAAKKIPKEATKVQKDYGEDFDWTLWQSEYGGN
jgi:hypothetical protein